MKEKYKCVLCSLMMSFYYHKIPSPISIQSDARAAGMSPFLMSPGIITPRRENIDLDDIPEAIRSPHSMNLLDHDGTFYQIRCFQD